MTLQRVLRSMLEGKASELTSSWADKTAASDQQRIGGMKKLVKSAVIWVRPEPRSECSALPSLRSRTCLMAACSPSHHVPSASPQVDYMSVPQSAAAKANGTLQDAITSIPAYVAAASLFLCICPRIKHRDFDEECDLASWSMRAWVSSCTLTQL
jgi:hypothetical protein